MEIFYLLMLFVSQLLIRSLGNSLPLSTIYSRDGDIIDCIRRDEQPAFAHPLLKDHIVQEYPTGQITNLKDESYKTWQVWQETGEACPVGTIPVRREFVSHETLRPKKHSTVANDQYTPEHKYAIGIRENGNKIHGTTATFNVWDPVVEGKGDFSLAQLWLSSGSYKFGDLNTIEAVWQVYPAKYLDNQPRFLHVGREMDIIILVATTLNVVDLYRPVGKSFLEDELSGNWWLSVGLNPEPVGYWPSVIFTTLSDHAIKVDWGGEVLLRNMFEGYTKVQMGSGEFADKGIRKAAYVCDLKIAEDNYHLLPVQEFKVLASHPRYYTIKKWENKPYGNLFYFGGPGPLPSIAIHHTLASVFLPFFVSCLVFFLLF